MYLDLDDDYANSLRQSQQEMNLRRAYACLERAEKAVKLPQSVLGTIVDDLDEAMGSCQNVPNDLLIRWGYFKKTNEILELASQAVVTLQCLREEALLIYKEEES